MMVFRNLLWSAVVIVSVLILSNSIDRFDPFKTAVPPSEFKEPCEMPEYKIIEVTGHGTEKAQILWNSHTGETWQLYRDANVGLSTGQAIAGDSYAWIKMERADYSIFEAARKIDESMDQLDLSESEKKLPFDRLLKVMGEKVKAKEK